MKAYQEDLAYIHDQSSQHARLAAPSVLNILEQHGIGAGLVVDLGCGSGHLAGPLVAGGYRVLGVDYSQAMIDLARQNVPGATFVKGSFLKKKIPPCAAVTAVGEVLNYRFDRSNSRPELERLFQRVYEALLPGGLWIFDVAEPGRHPQPSKSFYAGNDWFCLVDTREDTKARTVTRKIVSLRKIGPHYRRSDEVHHLDLYRGTELAASLRRIGFRVRTLRRYGDYRFNDVFNALAAIVARKPR